MASEPNDPSVPGQPDQTPPVLKARPPKKKKFDPRVAAPVVADKWRQASEMLQERVEKVVPHARDNPELWYFKLLGFSFVGILALGALAGLLAFLITLRSPEMVSVPEVQGMALVDALETLQDYGLLGRIQQKNSENPSDKGSVLAQEPKAGSHVRVGREVNLVVSRGNVVDGLASYLGRHIDEVRQEIKSRYFGDNPSLVLGQLSWAFNDLEEGTIISQDPEPGTPLNPPVTVAFLVSRGPDSTSLEVPGVTGHKYRDAISRLASKGIPFVFRPAAAGAGDPGDVTAQNPAEKELLAGGATLELEVVVPESKPGTMAGLFSMKLPAYSLPVDIAVLVVDSTGVQTPLYQFKHLGGELSFPYEVDEGVDLVVQALGKEIHRQHLAPKADAAN